MACARHGHVQKSQVFAQAFFFKMGLGLFADVQHQPPAPGCLGQVNVFVRFGIKASEAGGEGQAHHRIFQAFAGMNGHDLDQIGIALQPHHLVF